MTITCGLCLQIINKPPTILTPENQASFTARGVPAVITPEIEYQQCMFYLAQHFAQHHPNEARALEVMAGSFQMHLVAKSAISTDPDFERLREEARAFHYWALKGEISIGVQKK